MVELKSRMRIISGEAKGKALVCVTGEEIRPTPERMRQALFNILAGEVAGASILDLFSGTGSLGLEALSRGAEHCVFVEAGYGALQALRKNIECLNYECRTQVLARDVFNVTMHVDALEQTFDVVFAAPPYAVLEGQSSSNDLFNVFGEILHATGTEEATLNLQHSPNSHIPEFTDMLQRTDHRRYGFAELSRFEKK
ncbi:MAG: 16S rRNA (guanine(966)-N(2))-methyltransferase RsmD [Planctomycetota bacterium]|nr:16S rRNA (guanine(966)-N(2))-methyltransferase RsmD [Planctomycetota bacterium]